jgi:predicted P-loop ATPase
METSASRIAPVPVVIYESATEPTPVPDTLEWSALAALLGEVSYTPCAPCPGKTCKEKDGLAWSPVVLHETCQLRFGCKDPRHATDPNHPATRNNANVLAVTTAVLDLDGITEAHVEALERELAGLAWVVHSTHSHRGAAAPGGARICLRAVIALSRHVTPAEYPRFHRALVTLLGVPADPAAKDLSRLYYLPSVQEGGEFIHVVGEGEPLDVDAVLASAGGSPPAEVRVAIPSPPPAPEPSPEPDAEPVDLESLRRRVAQMSGNCKRRGEKDKAAMLDNLLAGRELVPQGQGQDAALHTVVYALASKFPMNTPADAAIEVLRRSINAMGAGNEGIDFWFNKAAKQFAEAQAKRVERDRVQRERELSMKKGLARVLEQREAHLRAKSAPKAEGADGDEDPEEDRGWTTRLRTKPPKDEGGVEKIIKSDLNVCLLLEFSPEWCGKIRWNDVRREVEVVDLPDNPAPLLAAERQPDILPRAVANWMTEHYDLDLPEGNIAGDLLYVARKHVYDPIREYLEDVEHTWDGKGRLDTFLEDYCGAKTTGAGGTDITAHVRRVSAKWLISAAARGLWPGCKVDTLLILESPQGRKKTSLFETLGGAYHATARTDMEGKDSMMVLSRSWIVELAELSVLKRHDHDAAKAFFSTRMDLYRLPYAKAVTEQLRRTVFAGTTNPNGGYFNDRTGNRRYWPITVEQIDLERVKRDRDQLFAEAVVRARRAKEAQDAGAPIPAEDRWWLEGDQEEAEAEAVANERLTESTMDDAVWRAWLNIEPKQRPVTVTVADMVRTLNVPVERATRTLEAQVAQALLANGFARDAEARGGGRKTTVFRSTPEMRALPVVKLGGPRPPMVQALTDRRGGS